MKKISLFLFSNFIATLAVADLKMQYIDINDFKIQPVQDESKAIQYVTKVIVDSKFVKKDRALEFVENLENDREALHNLFIVTNKAEMCGVFIGEWNPESIEFYQEEYSHYNLSDCDKNSDDFYLLEMSQEMFEEYPLASSKISFVFIEPNYRRQGIATKLVTMFEELSKKAGCTRCHISYDPSYAFMEKFALKNGYKFQFASEYKSKSGAIETDAIYMMKNL